MRELVVSEGGAELADLELGTTLGDWRIESRIGQGGMGAVYSAVHVVIGKRAAIKVVRAELCRSPLTAERFVQEARVVNQIGHPNIVDIFHIGRLDDGRPYLVMELLRGKTLADRMAEGRMSPREAIDVLLGVSAAVGAAHAHGVVHRDLKPDNIFLSESGVKVVDWGIAKLVDVLPVAVNLTTTGVMLGTPQYVSPEQARGKKLDAKSDIYSLGAIAYEMFLEGPPFIADNVADVVSMHLREEPAPPSDVWPDIPKSLERLLLAMLEKDPEKRPALDEVTTTLHMVKGDLDARGRRLANGSVPPPFDDLVSAPITVGKGSGVMRAHATPTPSGTPIAPDLSGDMPRVTHVTTQDVSATSRRWPWLVAALSVGAATIAAIAIVSSGPRTRAPHVAPAPAPTAASGSAVAPAPVVTPLPPPPAPAEPVRVPTLDIRVVPWPAGAKVAVDGLPVEAAHGHLVRPVAAGDHEVRVTASGYAPYTRTITVEGTVVLDVVLAKQARRTTQPTTVKPNEPPAIDPNATIEPFQ
ncbi:MAG TPA: serine/threonine-protein kinase [Kofleriaceae bacterium]|nr:serine/threonine-protein kinase [Kofleriaceae bacterium]